MSSIPPAENPPVLPFAAIMRWHGMTSGNGFAPHALPAARCARGEPLFSASCEYDIVCPYGISVSFLRIFFVNGVICGQCSGSCGPFCLQA